VVSPGGELAAAFLERFIRRRLCGEIDDNSFATPTEYRVFDYRQATPGTDALT
jgi:hypothetical protein